jgi:hypothetical protein
MVYKEKKAQNICTMRQLLIHKQPIQNVGFSNLKESNILACVET